MHHKAFDGQAPQPLAGFREWGSQTRKGRKGEEKGRGELEGRSQRFPDLYLDLRSGDSRREGKRGKEGREEGEGKENLIFAKRLPPPALFAVDARYATGAAEPSSYSGVQCLQLYTHAACDE